MNKYKTPCMARRERLRQRILALWNDVRDSAPNDTQAYEEISRRLRRERSAAQVRRIIKGYLACNDSQEL